MENLKAYYNLMKETQNTLELIKKELENFMDHTPLTEAQRAELEDGIIWSIEHTTLNSDHWTEAINSLKFLQSGLQDGRENRSIPITVNGKTLEIPYKFIINNDWQRITIFLAKKLGLPEMEQIKVKEHLVNTGLMAERKGD